MNNQLHSEERRLVAAMLDGLSKLNTALQSLPKDHFDVWVDPGHARAVIQDCFDALLAINDCTLEISILRLPTADTSLGELRKFAQSFSGEAHKEAQAATDVYYSYFGV